jgi:hypothetical protein
MKKNEFMWKNVGKKINIFYPLMAEPIFKIQRKKWSN